MCSGRSHNLPHKFRSPSTPTTTTTMTTDRRTGYSAILVRAGAWSWDRREVGGSPKVPVKRKEEGNWLSTSAGKKIPSRYPPLSPSSHLPHAVYLSFCVFPFFFYKIIYPHNTSLFTVFLLCLVDRSYNLNSYVRALSCHVKGLNHPWIKSSFKLILCFLLAYE